MTAKKNKSKGAVLNSIMFPFNLDALKRSWRAKAAFMAERLQHEQNPEIIRLRKKEALALTATIVKLQTENVELRGEKVDFKRKMEVMQRKMEVMEKDLMAQKALSKQRLEKKSKETVLKAKAIARAGEAIAKTEEAKKRAGINREGKRNAEERTKKEKRARINETIKKKEAIERAKNAEEKLKRSMSVIKEMKTKWNTVKIEVKTPPKIKLPEKNPFTTPNEKLWLTEAIGALPESVRANVHSMVEKGRKRLPPSMVESQIDAALMVYLYTTSSFYSGYSRCYRNPQTSNEAYERMHYLLLRGLMDRGLEAGAYWRGMELDAECELWSILSAALNANCRGEHTFSLLTPQSASKDIKIAAQFGSSTGKPGKIQVIFCFESAAVDVREISAFPSEDECILPPGRVKVLSICKVGANYFCHVAGMDCN